MNRLLKSSPVIALAIGVVSAAASAQTLPPPPPPGAMQQAQPFLKAAGASDVYEITSSQVALKRSRTPALRRFAGMMIEHHTKTTNDALAAARSAGVTPPPPVLDAAYRAMIAELETVPAAGFDRTYLGQQQPAHEGALKLMTGYSTGGDTPALRTAATATVPIVRMHLAEIAKMRAMK